MGLIMTTKEQKAAWRKANADRSRAYSALYRAKKKGVEPPPEVLAQIAIWDAEKEAKKAATRERKKEHGKAYRDAYRARKKERYRERYTTEPEFRAKQLEKRRRQYKARITEKSEEEREAIRRRRRENMAKALRARVAKLHAEAPQREAKREEKKQIAKAMQAAQQMKRKPGRLLALMGWRGF